MVGATTENPFYSLVNPLLSRCQLFELYPLTIDDVKLMINRALDDEENGLGKLNITVSEEALCYVSEYAGGDIRNALNALEVAVLLAEKDKNALITIDLEIAKQTIQTCNIKYDRTRDEHYHLIFTLIKSIRGSDSDAALYWISAIFPARKEIKNNGIKELPDYLKDKTANKLKSLYIDIQNASDDHKYPHSYLKNWINQQYLPNEVKKLSFYKPSSEGRERLLNKRLDAIKNQD